jgi:hypothetical protein
LPSAVWFRFQSDCRYLQSRTRYQELTDFRKRLIIKGNFFVHNKNEMKSPILIDKQGANMFLFFASFQSRRGKLFAIGWNINDNILINIRYFDEKFRVYSFSFGVFRWTVACFDQHLILNNILTILSQPVLAG